MNELKLSAVALAILVLAGCGGSGNGGGAGAARTQVEQGTPPGVSPQACGASRSPGGRVYRVQIPSLIDGEAITFQVFEPDVLDCNAKHALIVEGHGYAGSRQTEKSTSVDGLGPSIGPYTAAGYAVISIDQRGHGESGGTVRVMDPDFEGRDVATILDWAEANLDYLRYRDNNLLLGSIGGSYGGGFQMMLWATDPKGRLDAMVPEITWNDLPNSLSPGHVAKSFWLGFLGSGGDINTDGRQDPYIRSVLLNTLASGQMPEAARKQLFAHSPAYFCGQDRYGYGNLQGTSSDGSDFPLGPLTASLPPTTSTFSVTRAPLKNFNKVDALVFQSPRDNLFNFNEGYHNFECLKKGGGDVRLLTSENGHGTLGLDLGVPTQALATGALPQNNCGPINPVEATLAWFDEKLLGKGNADSVIVSGKKVCMSLANNDAVAVEQVSLGGTEFAVQLPGGLPVPVVLGQLAPVVIPLKTIDAPSEVVAGIPRLDVSIGFGNAALDALCAQAVDPLLRVASCDSTVFVGLGLVTLSSSGKVPVVPELIDNQVLPLRGFGQHSVDMVGVAERLSQGDQLVLLVYGSSPVYAGMTSKDPAAAVVTVQGTVKVPLLGDLGKI
ncbi:CocE/NonD family hydrolase [Limnobacter sp.]|uniref:CocE/NonD family hydrolase n=1 Tax=Limnobacter sp. TaxID=2003368 RepID=UPI003512F4B7